MGTGGGAGSGAAGGSGTDADADADADGATGAAGGETSALGSGVDVHPVASSPAQSTAISTRRVVIRLDCPPARAQTPSTPRVSNRRVEAEDPLRTPSRLGPAYGNKASSNRGRKRSPSVPP